MIESIKESKFIGNKMDSIDIIRTSKQGLVGASQFFSLQGIKQEGLAKYLYNGLEIFTKTLSFSKFSEEDSESNTTSYSPNDASYSLLAASFLGITSAIDDVMIDLELYKEHQLTKLGCSMYASYNLSSACLEKLSLNEKNYIAKGALGLGLFGLSYFLGSGDIINAMRSNTKDCIDFSDKIFELSDGTVDPHYDLHVGNIANTVIGGGRQFLGDIKLDIGTPMNDVVNSGVRTSINIAISLKSAKDFKNALISKFSSIDSNTLIELEKDNRAQKAMENLLSNIDKASSSITKTAVGYNIKNFWQQILANQKDNIGLHSFIASNLFNNIKIPHKKPYKSNDFESSVKSKDISSIVEQLKAKEQLEDKSYFSELYSFGKKAIEALAYPLAASILVSAITGDKKEPKYQQNSQDTESYTKIEKTIAFYSPKGLKEYFTPVTLIMGMALISTEDDSQDALDDMQYLYDKIVEIQEGFIHH